MPIFLLSDVHPCGGGTALLRGSHKKVAGLLWERSGTTGLTGEMVGDVGHELCDCREGSNRGVNRCPPLIGPSPNALL